MRTLVASTAFDELDPSRAIRRLYARDEFLELVRAVTNTTLYRLADPLGAASVNVFRDGWEHAWHYDESEVTVTLSLQTAESGGRFEFTERLRADAGDAAFDATAAVVSAHSAYDVAPAGRTETPALRAAPFEPGALQIFAGKWSLHRVSPVRGLRLVAVFCFSRAPGFVNSPDVQRMFWGRAVGVG